jgi:hypothetical protein
MRLPKGGFGKDFPWYFLREARSARVAITVSGPRYRGPFYGFD